MRPSQAPRESQHRRELCFRPAIGGAIAFEAPPSRFAPPSHPFAQEPQRAEDSKRLHMRFLKQGKRQREEARQAGNYVHLPADTRTGSTRPLSSLYLSR